MATIDVKRRDAAREAYRAVKGIVLVVVLFIAGLIIFNLSTFSVGEGEQAMVLRLGKVIRVILDKDISFTKNNPDLADKMGEDGQRVDIDYGKGLHFKMPFIDQVKKYDSRLLTFTSPKAVMNTNDKKQYQVTLYAQWRIANPALFYQVYGTEDRASIVLDNTLEPILVQRINTMLATDFLSNKELLNQSLAESITQMGAAMRGGGVEVVDVQINRTLLPEANLQSTYDRMVANREKEAQQYRSEGKQAYQEAVAAADLEASKLLADATQKSKETMGKADAETLAIYAQSYSKDPEFYGYWRSLQALKNSLGHDATIVLDRNSPLWKELWSMIGSGEISAK